MSNSGCSALTDQWVAVPPLMLVRNSTPLVLPKPGAANSAPRVLVWKSPRPVLPVAETLGSHSARPSAACAWPACRCASAAA
jgi:hypothetical protein